MRRKLRNNIYFGVFPMLLLMLGLIAYVVILTRNTNVLVQSVSSDDYEALTLLTNLQRHLLLIKDRTEEGESVKIVVENLRRDLDVLLELAAKNEDIRDALSPLHERLISMLDWMGPLEADGSIDSGLRETILHQVNDRMFQLSQTQSELSDGIKDAAEYYRRFSRKTYYILAAGMTLAVFIALIISRKLSKDILNPIEELNDAVTKISKGDMNLSLSFRRKDEIGDFARAFAVMVRQLQDYRELTNQKLLRSTNALRNILEKTPDAMFVVRQDLTMTFKNPRAEALLNAPEFARGFPRDLREVVEHSFEQNRESFSQKLEEAIPLKVNSEECHFLIHTFPFEVFSPDLSDLTGESVDVIAVAVILQDVTLMHLADRLKSNLVSTVSHELKTPLTSARMSLYLLAEQQIGPLNEDQMEMVETAKDDLNRQLATIQNLLDLSRIESDSQAMASEPFQLNDVLIDSCRSHETFAEGAEVEMELDLPEYPIEVLGDAYRIKVVVNNFVSNAIKYSGEGSKVIIRCSVKDDKALVEVEDNGPGIDADKIQVLFDPYRRGGSDINEISGSGLGLTIARDVVRSHGGNIGCRSEIDEGSCFYFELPLFQQELDSGSRD